MNKAKPAAKSAAEVKHDRSLEQAAEVLFGTEENPVVLRDGRRVVVRKGQVRDVGLLMGFFNALLRNMSRDDVVTLVRLIEENRKKAAGTYEVPEVDVLVQKAFDASSLLLSVFSATYETLPAIVSALTELSEDDFRTLELDDGATVAFAVFEVNYRFFSQSLPLTIKAFLAGAAKKLAQKAS